MISCNMKEIENVGRIRPKKIKAVKNKIEKMIMAVEAKEDGRRNSEKEGK